MDDTVGSANRKLNVAWEIAKALIGCGPWLRCNECEVGGTGDKCRGIGQSMVFDGGDGNNEREGEFNGVEDARRCVALWSLGP
jgi:hypothetical protein